MVMDPNKLNGLNAEQKQVYFKAVADGAISAEEQRSLREKGVSEELIKELCGNNYVELDPNDSVAFTYKKREMTQDEKDQIQKQQNNNGAIALGGGALVGGIIGGLLTLSPAGAAAGAAIGAGLFGATSCSDLFKLGPNDTIYYEGEETVLEKVEGKYTVINIVDVNVNISIVDSGMKLEDFALLFNNALNQIIEALNKNGEQITDQIDLAMNTIRSYLEGKGLDSLSVIKQLLEQLVLTNNANQESIKVILNEINKKLDNLSTICGDMLAENKTLHEIITLLKEQKVALADIIAALQKKNVTLEQIVVALQAQGESLDLIIAELNKNGYALSDIKDLLVQNNIDNAAILEAMGLIIGQSTEVAKKLDDIVSLLKTGITLDQETHNILNKILDAVNNVQVGGGSGSGNVDTTNIEKMLAAILDVVKNLPTKDNIKQMDEGTKERLDKILAVLSNFMSQESALDNVTQAMLDKILAAIKNIGDINGGGEGGTVNVDLSNVEKTLDAILKAIENINGTLNNMDSGLKDAINNLTDLLNAFMKQEFAMGEKTQELIEAFMAKFSEFVTSEQANDAEMYDLVSKLTVTVQEFMKQEANMDAEEKDLAQKILNAINNLTLGGSGGDVTVNVDLSKLESMMSILLDKIGELDSTTKAILEAVLNGNKDFGQALDEIKNLIMENNKIAQGTQDIVAKLGDKLDNFENGIKDILLKILDEEQRQNVTQEEILAVLKAVKEDTAKGNDALLRIEEKLNLVAQTVNVLLETTQDMHEGTKALLIQILDKIPAACDCNIDEVIIKLEEIITIIKENPSDNNEGIVDDLEDLLG